MSLEPGGRFTNDFGVRLFFKMCYFDTNLEGNVDLQIVSYKSTWKQFNNNNNSEVLLGANIHRPDAPLASQEREESENSEGRGKNSLR